MVGLCDDGIIILLVIDLVGGWILFYVWLFVNVMLLELIV